MAAAADRQRASTDARYFIRYFYFLSPGGGTTRREVRREPFPAVTTGVA
jgi:hypothetical protein